VKPVTRDDTRPQPDIKPTAPPYSNRNQMGRLARTAFGLRSSVNLLAELDVAGIMPGLREWVTLGGQPQKRRCWPLWQAALASPHSSHFETHTLGIPDLASDKNRPSVRSVRCACNRRGDIRNQIMPCPSQAHASDKARSMEP
jgi:hypothetical protein